MLILDFLHTLGVNTCSLPEVPLLHFHLAALGVFTSYLNCFAVQLFCPTLFVALLDCYIVLAVIFFKKLYLKKENDAEMDYY